MSLIRDSRPLCEVLKEKNNTFPTLKLYKSINGKESITDNLLEATRFEFINKKETNEEPV
jgi:hypothetical protein